METRFAPKIASSRYPEDLRFSICAIFKRFVPLPTAVCTFTCENHHLYLQLLPLSAAATTQCTREIWFEKGVTLVVVLCIVLYTLETRPSEILLGS
ncbi:hypothetical protein P167DRAFT_332869 [Morchella conica CCBAS932]|uniref:Uncharacterized protein n=1 Tax=Morchella conica CCBAS932 TaxID=1392247 RepID=A0A3N4KDV7_9PEZI|nr:hypothetical protein P167DRAFT_332869 [Morchella conica CCBAS932]